MDTKTTANTNRTTQAKQAWLAASARFAAAEKRMERLNDPGQHSAEECYATSDEYGEAVREFLGTPAPDAAALRAKLALLLEYDEEDGPLIVEKQYWDAALADFDRIAGTAPQPVNHEPAASRIQDLAIQAGHAQAAAMQALHDAGDAPDAALALGALVSRLIGEIAEVAETIEAGRQSVHKDRATLAN